MKKIVTAIIFITIFDETAYSQEHRYDPPWNEPLKSSIMFTMPGVDNVPDIFGDVNDPQLVVFFAGNQFMCIDDLLAVFKQDYPHYQCVCRNPPSRHFG